ncbi:MAG: SpoIID/LytB domain-containing protein [bacterium]|nr:SpoIID/LytB domain-containing protein [bacterium]
MQKNNYSALFAVVMILFVVPFIPAMVEEQFNKDSSLSGIPTTHAATQSMQIGDYTSQGYVGSYGIANSESEDTPNILGVTTTNNNSSPPYQAQEVGRSNSVLNINPGSALTVWVDFLNTGQATWYNTGDHFLALNVANPTGRHSAFQHAYWDEQYYRPTRMLQNEVKPGQVGRFVFALQAPQTTGTYLEEFHLIAENLTFVDGGYTSFHIGVGEEVPRPLDYQAKEISRTKGGEINTNPGTALTFEIKFQNTGLKTWYNTGDNFLAMNVYSPIGRHSNLEHEYWNEYYYRPTMLLESRIYPGEIGTFRFAIQAPSIDGYYTEKFALVAENLTWVAGSEITLPFKVGNPVQTTATTMSPNIRVGLYETDKPIIIKADGTYQVVNMNTNASEIKTTDQSVSIEPGKNSYWRIGGNNIDTILEITNYENHPLWNSKLNDNQFRGTLEIRYSASTGQTWVINELPIEYYLRGLAEVSNGQPDEYLKALIIAARSYALWHDVNGGKHPNEYYDINATTDQVYRGYGFEKRSIDPIKAVELTAGQVITHPEALSSNNPDRIAVATYSSGTDGRTRDWNEVWSGDGFPWLLSVDDPLGKISNWNTLEANHMVGISAAGARAFASQQDKTFDWILKYYYTGVAIEKIY